MFSLSLILLFTAAPAEEPRPYHEISRDLRELMKREALAESEAERAAAIVPLCRLYDEIKRDPRLENAPTLQSYKAKLWSRLVRVKKDIERTLARSEAPPDEPESGDLLGGRPSAAEVSLAGQGLSEQLALVSDSMGGPAKVFSEGGGAFGGAPIRDYGDALVSLIERTIAPEFWEVNGGPGRIFYYAPLHALVVTATSEVHEKIGGVAGGLRRP